MPSYQVVSGVCLLIAIMAFLWWRDGTRETGLAEAADQLGLTFVGSDPRLVTWLQELGIRWRGKPALARARDIVTGHHRGFRITAWTLTHDDGNSTNAYCYVSVTLPRARPALSVARANPRPGIERSAPRFTTGDAYFDQTFAVVTADEQQAREILHPQVRQLLLHQAADGSLVWDIVGDQLMASCAGELKASTLVQRVQILGAMLHLMSGAAEGRA